MRRFLLPLAADPAAGRGRAGPGAEPCIASLSRSLLRSTTKLYRPPNRKRAVTPTKRGSPATNVGRPMASPVLPASLM